MSARRLVLSNKKLRGVARRIRALTNWSKSFFGYFPKNLSKSDGYWNVKIPVIITLVEGKQTNRNIKIACAQNLINAAYEIFRSKPKNTDEIRVTCCIVLPHMFSSEVCIFTSNDYFDQHTKPGSGYFGDLSKIQDRSLSTCWGLKVPEGFSELGILRSDKDEDGNIFHSEHWYFGEVNEK